MRDVTISSEVITLTRSQAAALCGLSPQGFDVWVRRGIVPPPIPGTRRWSRAAVVRAVDGVGVDVELDPVLQWEASHKLDPFEQWKADEAKRIRRAKKK